MFKLMDKKIFSTLHPQFLFICTYGYSIVSASGAESKTSGKMGHEEAETMASFASVAAMSTQRPTTDLTPEKSPEKSYESCLFQSSLSPNKSESSFSDEPPVLAQMTNGSDKNIFERLESDNLNDKSQDIRSVMEDIGTCINGSVSHDQTSKSHDEPSVSDDVSCDSCMQLQASADIESSCNSPAPRSPQSYVEKISKKLVNKSVKHLKKKLRRAKSKKFTRLKKSKYPASRTRKVECDEVFECNSEVLDSSVRYVCSESEPLPVLDLEKRKHSDSESDGEETTPRKKKPRSQLA